MRARTAEVLAGVAWALMCGRAGWADGGDRRALLVGISKYQYSQEGIPELAGPRQDLETMRALLTERFDFPAEKLMILSDARATRAEILRAFREHLIAPARAGSVLLFYYAGHGSWVEDEPGGDELSDHRDESIVPYDSGRTEHQNRDILDDELNALLLEAERKTDNITVILDSCFSGSGAKGTGVPRVAPGGKRAGGSSRGLSEGPGNRPPASKYVLLAAGRDDEIANESRLDGVVQGALTWALADVMRQRGANATYRDIMEEVRERVSRNYPLQHPQLEGGGMDRLVFGAQSRVPQRYVLLGHREGSRYELLAGSIHGLAVGSVLEVYPPGAAELGRGGGPRPRLVLEEVGPTRSLGRCAEPCELAEASRAVERQRPAIRAAVRLWLDPQLSMAKDLGRILADYPMVALTEDLTAADLRVRERGGRVRIERGDGGTATEGVAPGSPGAASAVAELALKWAKWRAITEVSNERSPLEVSLSIRGASRAKPSTESRGAVFRVGDAVEVQVTNHSDRRLYLHLLAIGDDGEVVLLYPDPGAEEAVAAGGSWTRKGLEATQSEGWGQAASRTLLRLVATTKAVDLRFLEQPPFLRGDDKRSTHGELEALEVVMRTAVGARPSPVRTAVPMVATDSWVTVDRAMVTVRE